MTSNPPVRDLPTTMQGLIQQSLNGPHDLTLVPDVPVPQPRPGEYLVKVGAAGLNFADVMQTRGLYPGGPSAPYIAGFEAAGEIVAVGADLSNALPVGTHVIGSGPGAFAEYVAMPAAAAAPVPSGWSDAQALGLVLNRATALAALRTMGRLSAGEWVLVHAAAGGVGQAAIRLAHHFGAKVVASASGHKHAALRDLGADVIVDRARSDLRRQVLDATGGVDVVLESVGRSTFETSLAVAKPFTGRVIVFGAASGDASISTHDLVFTHRVHIAGLHIGALAEQAPDLYAGLLAELGDLIRRRVLEPGDPTVFPLADGPTAILALAEGGTVGKLAIAPHS